MDNSSDKNVRERGFKSSRRDFIKFLTAAGTGALVAGPGKNTAAAAGIGGNTQPFSPL